MAASQLRRNRPTQDADLGLGEAICFKLRSNPLAAMNHTRPFIADNSSSSWHAEAVRGVQIAVTLVIFLVGIPLNGMVVWALACRSKGCLLRHREGTRAASSFKVYVLNLAMADLVLLLRTPLMLGFLAHDYSWPFGSAFCKVIMFLRGLGLYVSAFLLSAVALERCLCLLRPVWARLRRPAWVVPLACGLMWAMATFLSIPYLQSALLQERLGRHSCLENETPTTGIVITETVLGFLLPLLVFFGSNVALLIKVKQAVPSAPTSKSTKRMVRLYQMLFFTMLLFLTCWVPYFVCRFLWAVTAQRPDLDWLHLRAIYGKYISLYLVYAKSAVNPVLYVFAARDLGRSVRASIVSRIEKVFNDSSESLRRKSLKSGHSEVQLQGRAYV